MAQDLIQKLFPMKVQNGGNPLVKVGTTNYYHYAKDVEFASASKPEDAISLDDFRYQLRNASPTWSAIPFATVINGRIVTLHFLSDVAPIAGGGGGGGGGDKDVKALLEDGIIVTVLTSKP